MKTSTTIGIRSNNFSLIRVINRSVIVKNRIIILVCLICLLFVWCETQPKPVLAPDNAYYVATTGNDNNPGTMAQPWLTPQHALDTMVAGDTTYVKAGTYASGQLQFKASGSSSGGYITIQNYPGDTVNLILTYADYYNSAIETDGFDYLKLIGFNITCVPSGNTYAGIYIHQSDYVTVQNCYITGGKFSGIYSRESTHVTIDGCEVDGCCDVWGEECISFAQTSYFEIKNTKVHDPIGTTRIGICIKEGCHDGSVHNCEVYNLTGYYQGCIYIDSEGVDSYNIGVYNNRLYGNPQGAGLGLRDEVGTSANHDINFYNNIVYGCGVGFEFGQVGTETFTNCSVINNTFYGNSQSAASYYAEIVINFDPDDLTNFIIRNNIIYSTETTNIGMSIYDIQDCFEAGKLLIDHNLFYKPTGSWHGWSQKGTDYVEADPLFTSISNRDFSIPTGSPAKNAGSATLAPSTDYNGTLRPQGAGVDIGAYATHR